MCRVSWALLRLSGACWALLNALKHLSMYASKHACMSIAPYPTSEKYACAGRLGLASWRPSGATCGFLGFWRPSCAFLGASCGFPGPLAASCAFLGVSCGFLGFPGAWAGACWGFLGPAGGSCGFLGRPGAFWGLLRFSGASWSFWGLHGLQCFSEF